MNPKIYTTEQRRAGMRRLVLLHLKKFGGRATSREIAASIGKPLKNVWPRFTELAETGEVRDTGSRNPLDVVAGLAGGKNPAEPAEKKPFGGHAGRKTRADGLKPGSPEAVEADRRADAARKREARAEKNKQTPPPALPAAPAASVETVSLAAETPVGPVAPEMVDPVVVWTADDFRQCAPELIELAEAWRIDSHTKHAIKGKLPKVVVNEITKDAAFPPGSKKSLSNSSPVTLAKMFNSLKVPIAFKSVISAAPALAYIVVRDLQMGSRIERLIKDEAERAKQNPPTA